MLAAPGTSNSVAPLSPDEAHPGGMRESPGGGAAVDRGTATCHVNVRVSSARAARLNSQTFPVHPLGTMLAKRRSRECQGAISGSPGWQVTTIDHAAPMRQVYFHDPLAPAASLVVPSVAVAVRSLHGTLLLVRRCDSGAWELPGGRVDVGETAVEAAVRETAEEAGVQVEVTEFAGLFSDPGHVVRAPGGQVRQPFTLLFRARAVSGTPRGDKHETRDAAWVPVADLPGLSMEPPTRLWVAQAMAEGQPPYLG